MEQYSKEYGNDSGYLMKLPDCGGDNGIKMVRTHFMISDFCFAFKTLQNTCHIQS